MENAGFQYVDFDKARAAILSVMEAEVHAEDMLDDLTEEGKAFLLGYLNGYRECMRHVELAQDDELEDYLKSESHI